MDSAHEPQTYNSDSHHFHIPFDFDGLWITAIYLPRPISTTFTDFLAQNRLSGGFPLGC
jgi:uncharacterized membrane-anchored protein